MVCYAQCVAVRQTPNALTRYYKKARPRVEEESLNGTTYAKQATMMCGTSGTRLGR